MGHTNSTANLSLPQFIGTDKPTWLGDINSAFSDIDAYVGTNNAAVSGAVSDAASAVSQAASAVSTANAANTTAGNASTAATNAVGTANNAMSLVNQTNTKIGTLANLNTTDKTSIVNAINELTNFSASSSPVDLASYVPPAAYEADSDGYVYISANTGQKTEANIITNGVTFRISCGDSASVDTYLVFVKKGMELQLYSMSGNTVNDFAKFYPFEA